MLRPTAAIILLAILAYVESAPKIDPVLIGTLETKGLANILLILSNGSPSEILSTFQTQTARKMSRAEKLAKIPQALKNFAATNQADILRFLDVEKNPSATIKTFWITNRIIVRDADVHLVEKLMGREDIGEIREERIIPLENLKVEPSAPREGEQWGVVNIEAPVVWDRGIRGQGVVVSTIDTGVRGTHEALAGNFRSDHGWFDPEGESLTPNDEGGHGTHTMGILCGSAQGIGVAPESQWISCKGCQPTDCSEFALLTCGQFVSCPTDPEGQNVDCSKAPNLVSNSWAGGQSDDWYDDVIQTWISLDIVPVFGIGNGGPGCGSANSPGDSPYAIGVGSTTINDTLSSFSSVGPTAGDGRIKPDVAAPGSNVYSSYNTGDQAYASMSGTSMATPHAAGLAALILSDQPNLSVADVRLAMEKGSVPTNPTGRNCGGIDEGSYPNHHVGAGRIDAVNSINAARKMS